MPNEDERSNEQEEPQDGNQSLPELASNGEGAMGGLDPSWHEASLGMDAGDRLDAESRRLGLEKAVAASVYVSDVFFAIRSWPVEHHEALLAAIGGAYEVFIHLRTTFTGTLTGDFIRWCRGRYPGILAHQLAEVLKVAGQSLADQFKGEVIATVLRARPGRRGSGHAGTEG